MARELKSIEPLRLLISHRPIGLFSDIDGTLAPIVPRPEDARVTPRCRELVQALLDEGVRVGLITGRTPETARRMAGLDGAVYAANHGMSVWIDGHDETSERVREYTSIARRVFDETADIRVDGVFVEVTGPNVAFHYRRAADEEVARQAILTAIASSQSAAGFELRQGRKVVELRPPIDINKGTALNDLVPRLGVKAVLCLGDDQTDIDMFRALKRLRKDGMPGVSIAVRSEEATREVVDSADYFVRGISGVEWLLGELFKALRDQAS